MSFGGDIKPSVPGNSLKLALVLLGVSSLAGSFPVNQYTYNDDVTYTSDNMIFSFFVFFTTTPCTHVHTRTHTYTHTHVHTHTHGRTRCLAPSGTMFKLVLVATWRDLRPSTCEYTHRFVSPPKLESGSCTHKDYLTVVLLYVLQDLANQKIELFCMRLLALLWMNPKQPGGIL